MVARLLERPGVALEATIGSNIGLVAENRIDPGLAGRRVELERSVQIAVIGQGQGVHPQLFGPGHQLSDRAGPIEQAEMAVAVQMDEGRHISISARSKKTVVEKLFTSSGQVVSHSSGLKPG